MKKINQSGAVDFLVVFAVAVVVIVGILLFVRSTDSDEASVEVASQSDVQETEEAEKEEVEEVEKKETEKTEEKKEEKPAPVEPVITGDLSLKASQVDKGIALSWVDSGVDAKDGYKIVYSATSKTPEYGVHTAQYANVGDTSSAITVSDGRTYNFRICAYRPDTGSCDTYSSVVSASAPKYAEKKVVAGVTKIAKDGNELTWTFTGTAPHGFKVVINNSGTPTYPGDSVQYVGADSRSTELPKDAAGTYFVRLCKYTADANTKGGCTDYSNQIEYVIE